VGRVHDSSIGVEDDEAANQAMAESEARGWFIRESAESFPYIYSWDSPTEMDEWLGDEWDGFIEVDEDLRKAMRSAWALADGDARVQLRMKIIVARWRVVK
jgi:hypothetical protein